jgi:hypothetical protein
VAGSGDEGEEPHRGGGRYHALTRHQPPRKVARKPTEWRSGCVDVEEPAATSSTVTVAPELGLLVTSSAPSTASIASPRRPNPQPQRGVMSSQHTATAIVRASAQVTEQGYRQRRWR